MRISSLTAAMLLYAALCGCATSPVPMAAHSTGLSERLARGPRPLVVAHRGDSGAFPENTIPAFRSAVERRADLVELDFRQTADGAFVCLHDATLDRTTDVTAVLGRQRVRARDVAYRDLEQLDAGSWKDPRFSGTQVPTLDQALEVIQAGSIAMIEHKDGNPEAFLRLIRGRGLVDEVLVQSFDWDWLRAVRELEPGLTLAALGSGELDAEKLRRIAELGVSMVHWSVKDLRLDDIDELSRRGYLVCAYTIDPDICLMGALAIRLDAVTTNVPGRLLELRRD